MELLGSQIGIDDAGADGLGSRGLRLQHQAQFLELDPTIGAGEITAHGRAKSLDQDNIMRERLVIGLLVEPFVAYVDHRV